MSHASPSPAPAPPASINEASLATILGGQQATIEEKTAAARKLGQMGTFKATMVLLQGITQAETRKNPELRAGLLAAVSLLDSMESADAISDVLLGVTPTLPYQEFADDELQALEKSLRAMSSKAPVEEMLLQKYQAEPLESRRQLLIVGSPGLNTDAALLHYHAGEWEEADRCIRYLGRSADAGVLRSVLDLAAKDEVPLDQIAGSASLLARALPQREVQELLCASLSEPETVTRSKVIAAAALSAFTLDEATRSALEKAAMHEGNAVLSDYYRRILDAR